MRVNRIEPNLNVMKFRLSALIVVLLVGTEVIGQQMAEQAKGNDKRLGQRVIQIANNQLNRI
jgi:hypothetical protein